MFKKIKEMMDETAEFLLILSGLATTVTWLWAFLYFIDFGVTMTLVGIIILGQWVTAALIYFMMTAETMSKMMMELLVVFSVSFTIAIWMDGLFYLVESGATQVFGRIITVGVMMIAVSIYCIEESKK